MNLEDVSFRGEESPEPQVRSGPIPPIPPAPSAPPPLDDEYFASLAEPEPEDGQHEHDGQRELPAPPGRAPFRRDRSVDVGAAASAELHEQIAPADVQDELCVVIAGLQGLDVVDAQQLVRQVRRSDPVLSTLPDRERRAVVGLLNLLAYEFDSTLDGSPVDLGLLPRERLYGQDVRQLLRRVRDLAGTSEASRAPHRQFKALEEQIQQARAARSAAAYLDALAKRSDVEQLLGFYRRIQPPTTSRAVENVDFAQTALAWQEQEAAALAGGPRLRISSGYRALDSAMTRENEPLGSWAGGELHVIAAPTGNGKSAHSRRTLTAAAEDLVNGWGLSRARVYHAITEEEPSVVAAAAELLRGQRFHHLARNVTIAKIGASRKRLIKGLYDLVVQADDEARDTGVPITEFLPYMVIVDYIGGIVEDGEPADTVALEKSANLVMRGIAAWDFEMMAQFSGVSFSEYAGRAVPKHMEHHRCAVVVYAQTLSKVDGRLWYEPGSSATPIGDFTVEKPDGSLGWSPLKGDFRVPQRKDVRGSGVLLNHATSLIILHRSRPENNEVLRRSDGLLHVEDDRARFILAKVRNASSMPFVPMRFDSQRNGPRGQFYDLIAEEMIRQGRLSCAPCHREEGDPILPVRPARRPLAGVRY